ncbi:MAG: WYL domain-containing protein [Clostridiales bacterium]|nr:WYL domain-containing protein [Clostridiales bacterium]
MAYSELVKDYGRIRGYMRQFIAYGFRSRSEFGAKSARSYDNEKRRVESWLGESMSFRRDKDGKAVFLSVDSRRIPRNPLHKSWKAASFTRNDIALHFILLDILADGQPRTLAGLLESIDKEYLAAFENAEPIDISTLRKKLKEYVDIGLVAAVKQGKQYQYSLPIDAVHLAGWQNAIAFFSEENPLGVVGSFLLDKYETQRSDMFTFKHRYLLFALDTGVLLDLLTAIHAQRQVELEMAGSRNGDARRVATIPLRIFSSTQGGRQYLSAFNPLRKEIAFIRLDSIIQVKTLEHVPDYEACQKRLEEALPHIWGVSAGRYKLQHIEMLLSVDPKDRHIVGRLEREKRCGTVESLGGNRWRFSAEVYDARELLPWLRTFIGRIVSLSCSDKAVENQFWADFAALEAMYEEAMHGEAMYRGDGDVV